MRGKVVRRLLKIGDSGAVTLPPEFLKKFGLEPGVDYVELYYNGVVVVRPLSKKKLEAQCRKLQREYEEMIPDEHL